MTTTTINGATYELDGRRGTLITFLREDLGLTGTKPGCGEGECGACTVLVDGEAEFSCQLEVGEVAGRSVTTIEGLAADGHLHPVQQALAEERASQCGYCTPGMAMRAAALLGRRPTPAHDGPGHDSPGHDSPGHDSIVAALGPNLCRCGCYGRILKAVERAMSFGPPGGPNPVLLLQAGTPTPPEAVLSSGPLGGPNPGLLLQAEPSDPPGRSWRPRRPWDMCEPEEREWSALLGDGLVVVWPPPPTPAGSWPMGGGAWLHIAPSGQVTAFSGKVDVGQDNATAFRVLVAEELGGDLAGVQVVQGDTDICPFDMGTVGSRSMPDAGEALRRAAAGARRTLDELAPAGAPLPPGLRVEVLRAEPALRAPAERRLVGRDHLDWTGGHGTRRTDVVTGRRLYVSDLELPGMLYGAVLRPPVQGGALREVDWADALRCPGVSVVRDGDFAGVTAAGRAEATQALELVTATWDVPAAVEGELAAHLRSHPAPDATWPPPVNEHEGDVEAALAGAALRLDATYTTSYIAHVPLETRAALASWEGGRLTVWTGTQRPFAVRRYLADNLGLDEADVRVVVPPTGAGFGGKHDGTVALEAARLARGVGRPVKVHWSRAEEFKYAYMRPMAVIDVRAALDDGGRISAWDFVDINAGPAAIGFPYSVPNRHLRYQPAEPPLAQGSYRALGANANNFARESHIDELAHGTGTDPVEFRLRHIDDERLKAVLRAAAGRFGWTGPHNGAGPGRGQDRRTGWGQGVAVGLEKGGRVATCAEVNVATGGAVQVTRIVTAYECGAIVNRDTVVNQVEGATVMALGGALFESIPWEGGRLGQLSLARYRVPRFADLPRIDVVLVDRPDLPSAGAGETPMIGVAPAIANAIFAATGKRLRSLPLVPEGPVLATEDDTGRSLVV
jgi:nicotinate dehydrogenase subunit B